MEQAMGHTILHTATSKKSESLKVKRKLLAVLETSRSTPSGFLWKEREVSGDQAKFVSISTAHSAHMLQILVLFVSQTILAYRMLTHLYVYTQLSNP